MKAGNVAFLVFVMLWALGVSAIWSYTYAHGNGYRDAIREIPLYYAVTGEFPDQEWGASANGKTLLREADILDMLYPYGQPKD